MADIITMGEPSIHNKPRQTSHAKGEQNPTRYSLGCTLKMPTKVPYTPNAPSLPKPQKGQSVDQNYAD